MAIGSLLVIVVEFCGRSESGMESSPGLFLPVDVVADVVDRLVDDRVIDPPAAQLASDLAHAPTLAGEDSSLAPGELGVVEIAVGGALVDDVVDDIRRKSAAAKFAGQLPASMAPAGEESMRLSASFAVGGFFVVGHDNSGDNSVLHSVLCAPVEWVPRHKHHTPVVQCQKKDRTRPNRVQLWSLDAAAMLRAGFSIAAFTANIDAPISVPPDDTDNSDEPIPRRNLYVWIAVMLLPAGVPVYLAIVSEGMARVLLFGAAGVVALVNTALVYGIWRWLNSSSSSS